MQKVWTQVYENDSNGDFKFDLFAVIDYMEEEYRDQKI